MQIFGSISDNGKVFNFENRFRSKTNHLAKNNFTFSGNKIFIYIDGNISKLSNEIEKLTNRFDSINQKISYLYYIGFNFENHICGSFNIFLFDHNNKEFKLIRDSRGTKSIFYANSGNDLIFSSDQNIIINLIKNVTLNQGKLMEFLNMDYVSNKETYFKEIFRVPPSHYLSFKNNILISKKYNLSNALFENEHKHDSVEGFKKYLLNSVASVVKKDKKIGVMMSGGLDSSAITIALKENNLNQVYTYSANFDHINDSLLHETKYQKNVSEFTSYLHTSIQMEGKSPIKSIKKFTKILNQPLNVPNLYMFEEIANKLIDDKIQIVLDGNDGDTTVSHGFETLFFYIKNFKLLKFIKETYLYSKFKKTSFLRMIRVLIRQAINEIFNIKGDENKNTMLKADIAIKRNPKNNISYFSSHERKLSNELHFLGNEFRNSFFRSLDIDNYSPFYDEELINFCVNMPLKNKLDNGYTRKVLRDFLAEYLPNEHARRDKSILTSGLLRNFTIYDLETIKKEYRNVNQTLLKFIDKDRLDEIIANYEKEKKINESELIILQMFVSANTFLNVYKF